MSAAVRYVAHAATGPGAPVVAGVVGIDDGGQPVLRAGLPLDALTVHGWHEEADDERRAHALARAAEHALGLLGYRRARGAVDWAAQVDPDGRWGTTVGAELEHRA